MASIISAGTTSATALNMSADTSGILQLAYNNGTIGLTINASGNYGFATTTVATNFRAQFLGTTGSNTSAASSGTTQSASAVLRLQAGGGFTGTLDIGQGGGTGSWLQSCDTANLATTYPLLLNPVGGDVGVGTSSPGARLDVNGNVHARGASFPAFKFADSSGNVEAEIYYGISANDLNIVSNQSGGQVVISAAGSERSRITGSNFFVNTASGFDVTAGAFTQVSGQLAVYNAGSPNTLMSFYNSSQSARVGFIGSSGNSTSYNSGSDYRLKDNVINMSGALSKLSTLRPVTFTWKVSPEVGTVSGFIAHELDEVVPEAVSGEKDAMCSDGVTPNYQMVDLSKLVPLLTSAIQELNAKVTALENK